ncbi:MAG: site-2 protease family protein [Acidobacteriales bacterium]|nr:site-2 protease family protein [Candidatus Koribacter versatilis]MBI3646652.1 site-2 protease family protein [Terriglobales bacterium]
MSEPASPFSTALETGRPHQVWVIQPRRRRLWVHIVLLLATFLSTLVVGERMQYNFLHSQPVFSLNGDLFLPFVTWIAHPSELLLGIPFSLTLMFILLAHEMGHYLYARHYRVYATLPYFVPFPSLIGTLGAFIRIRSPIPSRAALFDIGIAGPIAGFIPACVALVAGLSLSHPIAANDASSIQLGFPLAFHLAARVLHIATPLPTLSLHPIAAAAWVGMFATALNLLPGGQLDGGHIVFSISPQLHRAISFLAVLALIPLGKYFWTGWLLWAVLLAMTVRHPAVPTRPSALGRRRGIAMVALLMLVLAFTPAPFTHSSGREVWPELRDQGRQGLQSFVDGVRKLLHRN